MKQPTSARAGIGQLLEAGKRRLQARHDRHYRDSHFHFWADMLLAGILVGLVIITVWLMVWQPRPEFDLSVRLAEAQVTSGRTQTFIIHYGNGEDTVASGVSIALKLPHQFMVQSAEPAESFDAPSTSFSLGELDKGERGEVSVTGIIQGEPGERQSIELSAVYQSGQIKKRLLDSLAYTIDASSLELSLEAPERAYREADFRGKLDVTNTADVAVKGIEITFPSTEIEVTAENMPGTNNTIEIAEMSAGETKSIAFVGRGNNAGEFDLKADASIRLDQRSIRQTSIARRIAITEPNLTIRAVPRERNLAATSSATVIDLSFENLEDAEVTDLEFTILPARGGVTVASVAADQPAIVRGSTILYNRPLAAKQSGTLAATVRLDRDRVETNDSTGISVSVRYRLGGEMYDYVISAGAVRFNSNLSLASGGYYYGPQGDQLGVGPVPPRVDIPTTYWIIWQVNNLGNDVKDMQVTADLPDSLAWTDQKSIISGNLEYSPVNRRVLWRPGDIAKGGGNYRASFAISLVPRAKDLGTVPDLLRNIRFTATDAYTGAVISNNLPIITANIEADKLSAGKGTVLPLE